jgi:hypothetical protein
LLLRVLLLLLQRLHKWLLLLTMAVVITAAALWPAGRPAYCLLPLPSADCVDTAPAFTCSQAIASCMRTTLLLLRCCIAGLGQQRCCSAAVQCTASHTLVPL